MFCPFLFESWVCALQALAGYFDIVLVDDIPQMDADLRSEARRFITLIDELYEAKVSMCYSLSVPLL